MSDRSLTSTRFKDLLQTIQDERCVLFLGPQAAIGPSDTPIDVELNQLIRQILPVDPGPGLSLSHLCQLAGEDGRETVIRHLKGLEKSKAFSAIHKDFGQLPFPLIIQTTPDSLMINALSAIGKRPQSQAYDYKAAKALEDLGSIGSEQEPLVYGLRGMWTLSRSVPLSADEEASHLVALVREQPPLPKRLSAILRDNGLEQRSALFVGFEFAAWQTRLLLHALFATAPTTVIKPSPAVATPHLRPPPPTVEDMEFLWASYRIMFTEVSPTAFAADLLRGWREVRAVAPRPLPERKPDQLGLVNFISKYVPDDKLHLFAFTDDEFDREYAMSWQRKEKTEKARELIRWFKNKHRLSEILDWLRHSLPDEFDENEDTLFQS